jgi:dTDP-4-dehydrorhamnose reductase
MGRIVADQIGAPTSAALIANAIFGTVAEGLDCLRDRCVQANGLVHLAAKGETSWHGFACAIVAGLKHRGMRFAVRDIVPIGTDEYPTRAKRPRNSRLEMTRLNTVFGIDPPHWQTALEPELDRLKQTQNEDATRSAAANHSPKGQQRKRRYSHSPKGKE